MEDNINLNLYRTFYEVAKNSSISIASKNLYVSQPAISKSIKALEDALNTKLFYRTTSGVILTQKGEDLFKSVRESLSNLEYAKIVMNETENLERRSLTIGAPSHIISFFLLDSIYLFHDKYPNIDITIISRSSSELLNMLNNNEVDFVIDISSYKDKLEHFNVKQIKDLKYCFVMSSQFNISDEKEIKSISDLKDLPLILPVFHSSHRKKLNEYARKRNVEFSNVISIETSEIIYNTIKNKLGIGYILYDIVKDDIKSKNMKLIKIEEELPIATLNLIYKNNMVTIASNEFIENFIKNI